MAYSSSKVLHLFYEITSFFFLLYVFFFPKMEINIEYRTLCRNLTRAILKLIWHSFGLGAITFCFAI